jgi:squalene/oxidosqualene cyclase-like protein
MNYIALRLLGVRAEEQCMVRGREFIHLHGGGQYTGSWAKLYMCLLGVMDWAGHNVIPPEMWLLPNWFPLHPGRMWCHCRMVYLPMCYLYGAKYVYAEAETDPLIAQLRDELYTTPYDQIPWPATVDLVADIDNYSPIHPVMRLANAALRIWENWGGPLRDALRARGMRFAAEYMAAEEEQTNYVCIGPVNKVLNIIVAHARSGAGSEQFLRHLGRVPDYLWVSEDGMKAQGYNGSQGWDASFTMQALAEAELIDEFPEMCRKAYAYLERTQILCTTDSRTSPAYAYESGPMRRKYFRHVSEGGWPFSTAAHGWPISDCTAEGLKAVLALRDHPCVCGADRVTEPISDERLYKALNVLLTLQNTDGGWATYENNRGFGWYEWLNPSEVFADIMIDYSYVECSMASLSAVYAFHKAYPKHRTREVAASIERGRRFIKSVQRKDGSWRVGGHVPHTPLGDAAAHTEARDGAGTLACRYGSWGCCFTYGTWFGVEGLVLSGEPAGSDSMRRACAFLLEHQNANGGWGEDFTSCYDRAYSRDGMAAYGDEGSGVVNTAWALLALMAAGCEDSAAVARGIAYLMLRQEDNGDWAQEGIAGVFNRACGISYTQYRNIFPMWALARFARHYGPKMGVK